MLGSNISKAVAGLLLAGGLVACGGGSSGGSSAVVPAAPVVADATIDGVAASGAPIVDGLVTLTCAGTLETAKTVATNTTTGAYSFSLANCTAPYVISVTGTIGDSQGTLVSVLATAPAAGANATINITPLTHAIAATLSSTGDPQDLVTNIATEKAGLTATLVTARKDALTAALADSLATAGLKADFDIMSGKFSADRTGMDKVLDNVKVQVSPTAGVSLTNVAGVKVDDMANNAGAAPAADLSAGAITLTKTSTAATVTKLPAALDDHNILDFIRDQLNTCFAQAKATRGSFAASNLSTACAAIPIASDYLHDGKNRTAEFDPLFTSSAYDGAVFAKPEVIRTYISSTADSRHLVKIALKRTDGVAESLMTVGQASPTLTGGERKLRGNQRLFKVFVNGFVDKRVQIATKGSSSTAGTTYTTGANFYIGMKEGGAGGTSGTSNTGRAVGFVKVSGPGLPATGLFLRPTLAGCDSFYAIAVDATSTPTRCTSLFRISSRAAGASDPDNSSGSYGTRPDFAAAKVSDTVISAIKPDSSYKFELFSTTNATVPIATYYERMRSRPLTMGTVAAKDGEIDKVRWNTLSAETIALINAPAGTAFVGGNPSSLTLKWKNEANTAPIYSVQVQSNVSGTTLFQDQSGVSFTASSVVLTNGTQGWPNMGSITSTSGSAFNLAQIISRNQFDTQIFATWIY